MTVALDCEAIEWVVGKVAVVTAAFTDTLTGDLADPTTVTIKAKPPTGATLAWTWASGDVTRLSEGVFQRSVPLTAAGRWRLGAVGTGQVATVGWVTIQVREDPFA